MQHLIGGASSKLVSGMGTANVTLWLAAQNEGLAFCPFKARKGSATGSLTLRLLMAAEPTPDTATSNPKSASFNTKAKCIFH